MVPVTLVVLHPGPVHTEIGSAFAVPWVKARIPKTARANNEFLRFENLGINVSLGVNDFSAPGRSPGGRSVLFEACIGERKRGKCALKNTSQTNLPVGSREYIHLSLIHISEPTRLLSI